MKKTLLAVVVSLLSLAGVSFAQAPMSEIRESTDPAKAAAVEQRAADIQARQQAAEQRMSSGGSGADAKKAGKKHKAKKQPAAGMEGGAGK
ncbi:MAG: hypothetical protein ACREX0_02160 [Noviherbaspirillum sp.]